MASSMRILFCLKDLSENAQAQIADGSRFDSDLFLESAKMRVLILSMKIEHRYKKKVLEDTFECIMKVIVTKIYKIYWYLQMFLTFSRV